MRRLALILLLSACDGRVGELGESGPGPDAVVGDPKAPKVLAFTCDASEVTASRPLQCTVQAAQPDGLPLTCALDPGDGQPVIQLGDCAAALSTTVRFRTPGSTTMRLVVSDEAGRSSVRTVNIDVTGLPNQPPEVSAFTATPARGVTPMRTTLTFTATDPEADALTCTLDVGDDGTIDYPAVDCGLGRQELTLSTPGTRTVRLSVCDALQACTTSTVSLVAVAPIGDIRLSQVDFGQTIVGRDLRLVEGKAALLRVSAIASAPNLAGIVVEAEVKKAGVVLGTVTLTGPASPPTTETLSDLTKQYRTILPKEWVAPGLEITVRIDPADVAPETDETNNAAVLHPAVGRGNVMHLTAVPVVQSGLTGGVPDVGGVVTKVWPFKEVEVKTRAPFTFSGVLSGYDVNAWGQLLNDLASLRAADGSERNYYGLTKVSYGSGVAGIGYVGQPTATGRDDSLETAAHELGHNLGRPHAPCGGAASPDPSYPYANAAIGSWGWDGQRLIAPTSAVDLMSYCSPSWVSDYNYGLVQRFAESSPTMAGGLVLPSLQRGPTYLLAGRVKGDEVSLSPVYRMTAHSSRAVPESGWSLRLVTTAGLVRLVPIELWEAEDDPSSHFVAVVEDFGELRSVELLRGSTVIFSRAAVPATSTPAVKVTRIDASHVRVEWNAVAYPFAAVAHLDDLERTTLALRLSGGSAVIDTGSLTGGSFEVSVSDGLASRAVVLPAP